MAYSELYLKQKYHFSLILLLVIPMVLIFTAWFFMNDSSTTARAVKQPGQVEIVNLTDNQIGIYWQTDTKESSWISYGDSENNLNQIALDERDIEDKKGAYLNHYVLLKNLKKNTEYYFEVINGKQIITAPEDKPFSQRTLLEQTNVSNLKPAYGKILNINGNPLEGATVILAFENAYPLLTFTKSTGEWLLPLNAILETDTNKKINISEKDIVNIVFIDEEGKKTAVVTNLKNLSPLPQTIINGKTYEFLQGENILGESDLNKNETKDSNKKIHIIYPLEGAFVASGLPLISGIALPAEEVSVSLNTKLFGALKVIADQKGKWTLSLPVKLSAGNYILTVITKDKNGQNIKLKRSFAIAKSGEQIMGQATSSATPTLTKAPTVTPLPTQITTPQSTQAPTNPVPGFDPALLTFSSGFLIVLGIGLLLAF